MIAFLLAAQIAGTSTIAPAPTFIIVRDGQLTTSVPVTINNGDPSVRADVLMKAMRGMLITGTNLHFTLALPRARLDLIDGIPFAKLDTLTVPLTRAPQVRGGQLYLPFQFVSEVIPRYGGGYFYDVAQGELRTFASTSVASAPAPRITPSTSVAGAPAPRITPSAGPPPVPRPTVSKPLVRKLVVIDAGHGGPDRGMTGPIGTSPWFTEEDVTLSVAMKLGTVR